MYYKMGNTEYNLDKVVRIRHLKDVCRYGYFQATKDVPEVGWFTKWMVGSRLRVKGEYYQQGWDSAPKLTTKEKVVYSANFIRIWFVTDKDWDPSEWEMKDEASALNLIELCKNNSVCKFK